MLNIAGNSFFRLVVNNISRTKLRIFLTSIGVAIASTTLALLISIGATLESNVLRQISGLGVNYLTIVPVKRPATVALVEPGVISRLELLPGVEKVIPRIVISDVQMRFQNRIIATTIIGVKPDALDSLGLTIERGDGLLNSAFLTGVAGAKLVSSGDDSKENFLQRQALLQKPVELLIKPEKGALTRRYSLRIVGILAGKEAVSDHSIFVPINRAAEIRQWQGVQRLNGFSEAVVKVKDPFKIESVREAVRQWQYDIHSAVEQVEVTRRIYRILSFVLAGLGMVALIIAALGIVNTMLVAVYERTQEIGIYKVLGATQLDIMFIFLAEAGFVGLVGGILGIIFSYIGARLLSAFLVFHFSHLLNFPLEINLTGTGIFLGLSFSLVFSLLAGVYPAIKISQLNAARILRYE